MSQSVLIGNYHSRPRIYYVLYWKYPWILKAFIGLCWFINKPVIVKNKSIFGFYVHIFDSNHKELISVIEYNNKTKDVLMYSIDLLYKNIPEEEKIIKINIPNSYMKLMI